MLDNLMLDQSLRGSNFRSLARRGARKCLSSSTNLTSMMDSHNLTSILTL